MSIQRSQSSQATDAAQRREQAERTPPDKREPPNPENIDRFRAVMDQVREGAGQQAQEGMHEQARKADAVLAGQEGADVARAHDALSEVVADKAVRRADDLGLSASSLPPADALALFQAQMALRDGTQPTQAPPPASNPQAFIELIERHVRQLAVGEGVATDDDGQVLLRMADATLPGTDLLLTRNADGWTLRADVRSRSSFDAIREAAPELAKRFAERNLGTLSIDPHFHG